MKTCRYGGYSSVAERQTVALDVVGSTPTTHPKISLIAAKGPGLQLDPHVPSSRKRQDVEQPSRLAQSEEKAQLRWYPFILFPEKNRTR
jgi:hypothetical protein